MTVAAVATWGFCLLAVQLTAPLIWPNCNKFAVPVPAVPKVLEIHNNISITYNETTPFCYADIEYSVSGVETRCL